jgi:hypothetical protein
MEIIEIRHIFHSPTREIELRWGGPMEFGWTFYLSLGILDLASKGIAP